MLELHSILFISRLLNVNSYIIYRMYLYSMLLNNTVGTLGINYFVVHKLLM